MLIHIVHKQQWKLQIVFESLYIWVCLYVGHSSTFSFDIFVNFCNLYPTIYIEIYDVTKIRCTRMLQIRLWVTSNNIVPTVHTIKTEHLQESTLHSFTNYSRLIAQCTVCIILLSADTHSTDTGLKHSSSHIHFSTTQWTMQFCSYSLPSLCCPHSLSATYNTLTRHDMTVLLLLKAGLVCHFRVSRIFDSVPVSLLWVSGTLSFPRRHWHTGSLDTKGFADRHTTRRCCPLLQ